MNLLKYAVVALIGGACAFSSAATFLNFGVDTLEHPQGVSIRETSTSGSGHFFFLYATRSHMGGGISSGK